MDKETLKELVAKGIPEGITNLDLLLRVGSAAKIEARRASRPSLLRIYKRRLKYTRGDDTLLKLTEDLVHFLDNYAHDELLMVSIDGGDGYYTFVLTDTEASGILHWMKMFGQGPPQPERLDREN